MLTNVSDLVMSSSNIEDVVDPFYVQHCTSSGTPPFLSSVRPQPRPLPCLKYVPCRPRSTPLAAFLTETSSVDAFPDATVDPRRSQNILLDVGSYDFFDTERRVRTSERRRAAQLASDWTRTHAAQCDSDDYRYDGPGTPRRQRDAAKKALQAAFLRSQRRGSRASTPVPFRTQDGALFVAETEPQTPNALPPQVALIAFANTGPTRRVRPMRLHDVDGNLVLGEGTTGLGDEKCRKIAKQQLVGALKRSEEIAETHAAHHASAHSATANSPKVASAHAIAVSRAREKMLDQVRAERKLAAKAFQEGKVAAAAMERQRQADLARFREVVAARRREWEARRHDVTKAAGMINMLELEMNKETAAADQQERDEQRAAQRREHHEELLRQRARRASERAAHVQAKHAVVVHMSSSQRRLEEVKARAVDAELREKTDLVRAVKSSVDNGVYASLVMLRRQREKAAKTLREESKRLKVVNEARQSAHRSHSPTSHASPDKTVSV